VRCRPLTVRVPAINMKVRTTYSYPQRVLYFTRTVQCSYLSEFTDVRYQVPGTVQNLVLYTYLSRV